jgi:hypothetical protein
MRRCALWRPLALAAAAIVQASPALPDEPLAIGRSIFVVADVEGRLGEAPPKRIAINDDVAFQEDITTGDDAKTIIEFRDGSTFEVGPGSVVRIDSFVFNPDEGVSRKAMSVGRGVFRYISGYAAPQQDTQISTSIGTLAIRGSVVSGIVEPDVPTFVYVGEGSAVFTNDAGSADLQPGNSLAVPSRTTPVMRPSAMPPSVVAQALQAIDRRLPPSEFLRRRPSADAAWLRRAGNANLLPIAEQARREAAAARAPGLTAPGGPSRLARDVNLLVEGNRRNLFDGAHPDRTPEQRAFITAADRALPQARNAIARSTVEAGALHRSANLEGTQRVIRGIAAAAPSREVLSRVATTAARSNPAAAAAIKRGAAAAYREPERPRRGGQPAKASAAGSPTSGAAATPRGAERRPARPPPHDTAPLPPVHGRAAAGPSKPSAAVGPPGRARTQVNRAPPGEHATGQPPGRNAPRKEAPGRRPDDQPPR